MEHRTHDQKASQPPAKRRRAPGAGGADEQRESPSSARPLSRLLVRFSKEKADFHAIKALIDGVQDKGDNVVSFEIALRSFSHGFYDVRFIPAPQSETAK